MKVCIFNNIFIFFIIGIVLFSCAGPKAKFIAGDYVKPDKIAVLPVINQTVDVKGAMVFRNIFYEELKKKDYTKILDMDRVDSLLNEEGITDGGQLSSISNEELVQILNTDGLIYIELLICGIQSFDIDAVERVKANFKLYVCPGKLIWEDEREEKKQSSQSKSSGNLCTDFITQFLIEIVAKPAVRVVGMALFEHECKQEMEKLIRKSLKTLP